MKNLLFTIFAVCCSVTAWSNNIVFADANVKTLCVANWDTNGDGELSEEEAAAVTSLGEVFKGNTTITSFDELSYFTGLTTISSQAFFNCTALASISFGVNVNTIEYQAFFNCISLEGITIPSTINTLAKNCFQDCSGILNVIIPASVTSIGSGAFSGCTSLQSIVVNQENPIYDSRNNCNGIIETVSNKFIVGCKASSIPEGITVIAEDAFGACYPLTSIVIPSSVESIERIAFDRCVNLSSVIIKATTPPVMTSNAFGQISDDAILYVPSGCKTAYEASTYWAVFDITEEIENVDEQGVVYSLATDENNNLCYEVSGITENHATDITIKNTIEGLPVSRIKEYAFNSCILGDVVIPGNVKTIEYGAFHFSELNSLTLCEGVTNIKGNLFNEPQNHPYGGLASRSIILPASLTNLGHGAFSCFIDYIQVAEGNPVYDSRDNCNCVIETATNKLIYGIKNTTIPETVTAIGDKAFAEAREMGDVVIPGTVKTIGDDAFEACVLTSLTLCEGITSITGGLFGAYGVFESRSIVIPASLTNVGFFGWLQGYDYIQVSEGNPVYDSRNNCNGVIETASNTLIFANKNTIIPETVTAIRTGAYQGWMNGADVVIPGNVKTIGWRAFHACNLKSLTLCEGITNIESGAFDATLESRKIVLPASLISIGDYALPEIGVLTVKSESPLIIGEQTFPNRSNIILYVPNGTKDTYLHAEYWQDFKDIVEGDGLNVQTLALRELPVMTYGDAAYELPETTTESLTLTWVVGDAAVAEVSGNVLTIKGAGTTTVTATQAGNDEYEAFSREFTLTVSKAALTITANDCTKEEGEENPELTVSYDGFVYDDDASSLITQPTITTTATTESPAGTYPITVSGATFSNYEITYVDGTLTVTEKPADLSNRMYAEDVSACRGGKVVLPIVLQNTDDVQSFQFDLTLPEGVTVATNGNNQLLAALTDRAAAQHSLSCSLLNNGDYRFIVSQSLTHELFSGNDGAVANITLSIAPNVSPDTYQISMKNIELTLYQQGSNVAVEPAGNNSVLTVNAKQAGDANGDGKPSVTDIAVTVDIILANGYDEGADANSDGKVTVTDIAIIVDLILARPATSRQTNIKLDPQ